jgi:hypothetical protein
MKCVYTRPDIDERISDGINVPLSKIRFDGGTQMRVETDEETVEDYRRMLRDGQKAPPVVLFFDGEFYWPGDGYHRCEAARREERPTVLAEVYSGTVNDAILFACQANLTGIKRPTRADKRKAVITLLQDPALRERMGNSNPAIAKLCGVDQSTVFRIREEIASGFAMQTLPAKRKGVDGKEYTAKQEKKKQPSKSGAPLAQVSDEPPTNPHEQRSTFDGPSPAHPPATSYSPASAPLPVSTAGPACEPERIEVRLALHTHRAARVVEQIAEREEALDSGTWAAIERLVGAGGAA